MEWRVLIIAQTFYLGFKRARLPSFGNTRCHIEAEEGLTATQWSENTNFMQQLSAKPVTPFYVNSSLDV